MTSIIWPPLKAWTSQSCIDGQTHFVAINYGGKIKDRWVIMMSVIDSNIVLKVSWTELVNPSIWKSGWDEKNFSNSSPKFQSKSKIRNAEYTYPSADSGLTIPITKNIIRPWFH